MKNRLFKNNIISLLICGLVFSLVSCAPYSQDQVLYEYKDMGVVYYLKNANEKYKYSNYIIDDVSSGAYKKSTPNVADYKNGPGMLDYDIPAYVNARMDYVIKVELIKKHEYEIDDMCATVRDGYFEYKKSYIYYYNTADKKSILLCEKPVTNITYDDETPNITFDVEVEDTKKVMEAFKDRKINLSDIIAANSTIEGFMKILLSQGKEKRAYFLDKRIDNDKMHEIMATKSEIG